MITISWRWLFVILILFGAWWHWSHRELKHPPGSMAPNEPIQTNLLKQEALNQGKYQLNLLADYIIEARVLAKEIYHLDRESELAPVDLALGWGSMSDSSVIEKLAISQSNRAYRYRWDELPPRPRAEIASHSANVHLIPASPTLEKQIKKLRVGQVIHISGQLVEAYAADGWRWRSSLSRDDVGFGACELIRVESLEIR